MAILTKIRNRSGLAIGFVGLALALFVISDALQSNSSLFGGNGTSNNVGEIDGEKISIKLFEQKYQENIDNYKKRTQSDNIDDGMRTQLREQTWQQFINDNMMSREYAQLGLQVSSEELEDLLYGNNIHPQIIQSFTDPSTQQFDKNNVIRYLKQVSESGDEKVKKQWRDFEDYIVNETEQRKYSNLIKKSVFATSLEAKNLYTARSRNSEVNVVALTYVGLSDSLAKPSEDEVKSYFKKNKDKYKERENSTKLDFVVWDFAPTSADSEVVRRWAFDQLEQFALSTNDTLYVDANSDVRFDPTPKPRNAFPEELQDRIFSEPVGSIVGPLFKNGKYQIFKISGFKDDSVYHMHAKHILFKIEGGTNEDTLNARKKAEDVLNQIKKGADFGAMALQHGTDGTREKGGDLGWFAEGQMVKEFGDAVKSHNKGDLFIVKTQFGFHIVKVSDDKSKKLVCAGALERAIEPSEATLNTAYNAASQFAAASTNEEEFAKNIADLKLEKRTAEYIRETDSYLPGFSEAREVVRWAFNAKVGSVSEVFTVGDNKYVIALLVAKREKEQANFESSKDRATADCMKEKKGEMLMEKMEEAMKSASTLEDVSKKLGLAVTPIGTMNFENPSIPYVGYDPTFAGAVAGYKTASKIVGPLKGEAGVYAYQVLKINEAPQATDLDQFKKEILSGLQSKLEYGYSEALKTIKGVVDNRYKFY